MPAEVSKSPFVTRLHGSVVVERWEGFMSVAGGSSAWGIPVGSPEAGRERPGWAQAPDKLMLTKPVSSSGIRRKACCMQSRLNRMKRIGEYHLAPDQ